MYERIRSYIDGNGFKIRDIAKKSEIEEKKLYRILSGANKLTVEDYEKICNGLSLKPEYFFRKKFLDFRNERNKTA